jgi:CBS domain-containing protein
VVDGGRVVGILSDRDLPRYAGYYESARVKAAMTPDPVAVAADVTIDAAAQLMVDRRVRALPVVEGERLVGIISSTDILEDYVTAARRR